MVDRIDYAAVIEEARAKAGTAFDAAQSELLDYLESRRQMDYFIEEMQMVLVDLAPACGIEGTSPIAELGLTDAIRYIFSKSETPLRVDDVKEQLVQNRVRLPDSNPLASIQTSIKRLEVGKDLVPVKLADSPYPAWTWQATATPPVLPVPKWMIEKRAKK